MRVRFFITVPVQTAKIEPKSCEYMSYTIGDDEAFTICKMSGKNIASNISFRHSPIKDYDDLLDVLREDENVAKNPLHQAILINYYARLLPDYAPELFYFVRVKKNDFNVDVTYRSIYETAQGIMMSHSQLRIENSLTLKKH